jgi:hypothetical protein
MPGTVDKYPSIVTSSAIETTSERIKGSKAKVDLIFDTGNYPGRSVKAYIAGTFF